jgi:Myb/SANT-like DNA-binding protein
MAQRQRTQKTRAPAAKWSDQDVDKLVAGLLEAKDNGQTSENGFKSTVWGSVAASFDDPLKNASRTCESKWTRLKSDYKAVKFLRDLSGFGWDEAHSLVTAEPEVWAELAKVRIIPLFIFLPSFERKNQQCVYTRHILIK